MISYDNFWKTMKKRGVTKYSLIYHYGISSNTLRRMSHGESITTSTINELCLIVNHRIFCLLRSPKKKKPSPSNGKQRFP